MVVGYHGTMYRTSDGGANWSTQVSGVQTSLMGIAFPDANIAVAVGDKGTIIRSTNGGLSWADLTSQFSNNMFLWFTGVSFGTPNAGIAVGKILPSERAIIYRTSSGGSTWTLQSASAPASLKAVSFGDSVNAFAVGLAGVILRTTNGGKVWNGPEWQVTSTNLNGVFSSDAKTATIVGDAGTILRTNDGGGVWIKQQSSTKNRLHGVWFVGSKLGLVVGDGGIMLRTTDGGGTWVSQRSGTFNALNAVCFTDAQRGTIVGDYGTILRTVSSDIVSGVGSSYGSPVPNRYALNHNYPNPFNPSTAIGYQLMANTFVTLKVYDLLGREIATLVNEVHAAGFYTVRWNASSMPSGVYLYRLQTRDFVETKKMLLLK